MSIELKYLLFRGFHLLIILMVSWAGTLPVARGEESAQEKVISLGEFLRIAAQKDSEFEEILVSELSLRYQKDLKLPARDFVVSVKENYSVFLDRNEEDAETSVGLDKLFPYTGTELSVTYDVTPISRAGGSTSEFKLTLAQPIAENAFGRSTRLLDKIVGIETDVSWYQIVEAYEDYLALLVTVYLDWYEAYENREIGRSSYQENLKLLDNIRERKRSQIALPVDVNKIKIQLLAKKEKLVSLEAGYERTLNFIKKSIREEDDPDLVPVTPKIYMESPEPFQETFDKFQKSGRTYNILRLLEEKSSLEVARDADDLLPSILVSAEYRRMGRDAGLESPDDRVSAGVSLEWPFPDQKERAEWEVSKIELEKTKLNTQNTNYRLYTQIRNLHLRMEEAWQLKAIADEKIELAGAVLKDETENFTFGKVTLNDYIDAVNGLDNNRFNQVFHDVRRRKLNIEWLRITDRLVTEDNIRQTHPKPDRKAGK